MPNGDLINFDAIEGHKENIQALPSGRSARKLVALFSPTPLQKIATPTETRNANDVARIQFESEVANIDEADDPLDVWNRYLQWTLDAYPSGQATPQSGLRTLLERATKSFVGSAQYKNDPRYLKMWVHYINFFSDAPREAYVFLSRHGIGEGLALYYEEYAAWLEGAGRWNQAEETYKLGIEREAQPAARLIRKFGDFEKRRSQQPGDTEEPSSPALPTARPALAAKVDPFAAPRPVDPQSPRQNNGVGGPAAGKPGKAKMAIFSDAGTTEPSAVGSRGPESQGWDSIGSIADRKKENTMEPRPWEGETLKAGGKKNAGPRMQIFRDTSRGKQQQQKQQQLPSVVIHPSEHQVTVHPQTGKKERVFVDLIAIYPTPDEAGTELSFEELWALSRGWMDVDWNAYDAKLTREDVTRDEDIAMDETDIEPPVIEAPPVTKQPAPKLMVRQDTIKLGDDVDIVQKPRKVEKLSVLQEPAPDRENRALMSRAQPAAQKVPLRQDENGVELDENGAVMERIKESRGKKKKVMEVNETQMIKAKLDSPAKPRIKKRNAQAEATMTMHTKAATDDIYEIFNQPLKPEGYVEQDDGESIYETDYETEGDCTSVADSEGTTRHITTSEAGDDDDDDYDDGDEDDTKSVASEWSDFTARKHLPGVSHEGTLLEQDEQDEQDEAIRPTGYRGEAEIDEHHDDDNDDNNVRDDEDDNSLPRTRTIFVPILPEDHEPPTRPYRDPVEAANNRLPFMTPITECTEASLNYEATQRRRDAYKTPSKTAEYSATDSAAGSPPLTPLNEDNLIGLEQMSSPVYPSAESPSPEKRLPLMPKKGLDLPSTSGVTPRPKGPVILDVQCNPFVDNVREEVLETMYPPLSSHPGFFDHHDESCQLGGDIRKYAKVMSRNRNNSDKASTALVPIVIALPDVDHKYTLRKELGSGAFAPVYLIENSSPGDVGDEADENGAAVMGQAAPAPRPREAFEALKMETPPSVWEFYMMRLAHARLGTQHHAAASLSFAHELHLYRDEAFLVLQYHPHGTLLDVVNMFRAEPSGVMDETLAMFFTVEVLRTVEALHSHEILHGDLKADNCMLRLSTGRSSDLLPMLSSRYRADGGDGWAGRGVSLIDFGRSIDMRNFVPGVQFIADWKTTPQDCAEIREGRPWTWQIDYHGLAGIVHCLLFGKYMDTVRADGGGVGVGTRRYKMREGLKRYWQTDIWGECFDVLLNPGMYVAEEEGQKMPALRTLRRVRERMETWLEKNCEKGVGLRALVGKVEAHALRGRR